MAFVGIGYPTNTRLIYFRGEDFSPSPEVRPAHVASDLKTG